MENDIKWDQKLIIVLNSAAERLDGFLYFYALEKNITGGWQTLFPVNAKMAANSGPIPPSVHRSTWFIMSSLQISTNSWGNHCAAPLLDIWHSTPASDYFNLVLSDIWQVAYSGFVSLFADAAACCRQKGGWQKWLRLLHTIHRGPANKRTDLKEAKKFHGYAELLDDSLRIPHFEQTELQSFDSLLI